MLKDIRYSEKLVELNSIDNPTIWVRRVMSKTGSVASAGVPIEPPSLDITGNEII